MNESKLSPEDERLINDMNDPALAEAFNVMRELDAWRGRGGYPRYRSLQIWGLNNPPLM